MLHAAGDPPIHSIPGSTLPGSPVHPSPRSAQNHLVTAGPGPALPPTRPALPPAQAVGGHTSTTASGGGGRDPCPNSSARTDFGLPVALPHLRQHDCPASTPPQLPGATSAQQLPGPAPQSTNPPSRKPLAGNTSFSMRLVGGSNSRDRKSGRRARSGAELLGGGRG